MTTATVNSLFDQFLDDPSKEDEILAEAAMALKSADVETLKKRIEGKKSKEAKKTQEKGKKTPLGAVVDPEDSAGGVDIRNPEQEQKAVEAFWMELEKMDPMSLVSEDVTDAFKYVGFDPDTIIRELLFRGRKAGKDAEDIKRDMVSIVTVAIIKGSVTDNNLKKTSDAGKVMYKGMQDTYGLVTGGARGKDSTHLSVARVAAAVPGVVTQVLIKRPGFAKTFVGPFGSKSLPPYLRHQSAAACIPEKTPEKLKEYLLGLITAFTADQSKVLSKGKEGPEELFDKQLNFVMTTHNSKHPSEGQRINIFNNFSLSNDYDRMNMVAIRIKKVKPDFVTLTQVELDAELAK
jgi:hypothetical protein